MAIDSRIKSLLEYKDFSQIHDPELIHHGHKFTLSNYTALSDQFIKEHMIKSLLSSKLNNLYNTYMFPYTDIIIGVTHFIDNLIMKHGLNNIQILEHDYKYYTRLSPNISYAQVGKLNPDSNLILSLPFAGHCDIHDQMGDILEECNTKNINLHLDCAWMGSSKDINFNLDSKCIKSFALSFSKPYGLGWNRIGIRWSREVDDTDSITIFNKHQMYNSTLIRVAYHYISKFDIDYLWNKYGNAYDKICKSTYTMPTKIIWLGKTIKGELVGFGPALLDVSMSN